MVNEFIIKHKVDSEDDVRCKNSDEDNPVVACCPDRSLFLFHLCSKVHKHVKTSRGHGKI